MVKLRPLREHRGRCPRCGRDVSLLSDGTVARAHFKDPDAPVGGRRWCDGWGQRSIPPQPEETR